MICSALSTVIGWAVSWKAAWMRVIAPSSSRPLSVSCEAEIFDHRLGDAEATLLLGLLGRTALQHLVAQVVIHRADLGDETAGQPRAHPRVEAFELHWRAVGRHHHLLAAIDQRIQRMAEFLLEGAALQKFDIVDEQDVDGADLVLECHRVAGLQRFGETVHEALGRQVEQLGFRLAVLDLPGDGVEQMGFAEADLGVDVERIVAQRLIGDRFGHLQGGGMGEAVGRRRR